MTPPVSLASRISSSPVAWSWLLNGLRVGAGLILLPLLLRHLSPYELGVHFVLNNLLLLLPTIDSAVSFNLVRFISYAWNGATSLQARGIQAVASGSQPNFPLVGDLLRASQSVCGVLAIAVTAALFGCGWFILKGQLAPLQNSNAIWLALALTAVSAGSELYWGRWNSFLKGQNQVLLSLQLQSLGYGLRLAIASCLLLSGVGILSVAIAGLVAGTIQRWLSRAACLRFMGSTQAISRQVSTIEVVRILLPSGWRVGMQLLSQFAVVNALSYMCVVSFGLPTQAQYGLSLQLFGIIATLASVWFTTQAPRLNGLRLQQDIAGLRAILHRCLIRQAITFLLLAVPAVLLGPWVVDLIEPGKDLLPVELLAALALHTFMEVQFNTWTITAATENLIPSAWPATISNVATILVAAGLLHVWGLGIAALILAPVLTGLAFNYWYWPWRVPLTLGTTFFRLLAARPTPARTRS